MKDFIIDNKIFYEIQYNFITYFNYIVRILLLLYVIGAINSTSQTLMNINFFVKVFIAFFLMYRFNGYRKDKITFTKLDQKIAFSAGLYILIISFYDYLNILTNNSRFIIKGHLQPITNYVIFIKNYIFHLLQIPNTLQKTIA